MNPFVASVVIGMLIFFGLLCAIVIGAFALIEVLKRDKDM